MVDAAEEVEEVKATQYHQYQTSGRSQNKDDTPDETSEAVDVICSENLTTTVFRIKVE